MMDVISDTAVALSLTVLVGCIIAAVIVYYRRYSDDTRLSFVRQLVEAAEQLAGTQGLETGPDRLRWVLERIQQRYPAIDIDLATTLIESIVYRMNRERRP